MQQGHQDDGTIDECIKQLYMFIETTDISLELGKKNPSGFSSINHVNSFAMDTATATARKFHGFAV